MSQRNDLLIGRLFNRSEHRQQERLQQNTRSIHENLRLYTDVFGCGGSTPAALHFSMTSTSRVSRVAPLCWPGRPGSSAGIILWNTVYLQKAVQMLADQGTPVPPECMPHLSPLGWEHINMTGDYVWNLQQVTTPRETAPASSA